MREIKGHNLVDFSSIIHFSPKIGYLKSNQWSRNAESDVIYSDLKGAKKNSPARIENTWQKQKALCRPITTITKITPRMVGELISCIRIDSLYRRKMPYSMKHNQAEKI